MTVENGPKLWVTLFSNQLYHLYIMCFPITYIMCLSFVFPSFILLNIRRSASHESNISWDLGDASLAGRCWCSGGCTRCCWGQIWLACQESHVRNKMGPQIWNTIAIHGCIWIRDSYGLYHYIWIFVHHLQTGTSKNETIEGRII